VSVEVHTGGCFCSAVRYEARGAIGPLVNCHCQYCRRFHGAAFVTVAMVQASDFEVTSGASALVTRANAEGSRHYCSECGSRLFNRPESTDAFLMLVVGSLDDPPATGAVMHVNTESMAPWYEIHDSLPQYPGLPPIPSPEPL
jgi:hypothetical protein